MMTTHVLFQMHVVFQGTWKTLLVLGSCLCVLAAWLLLTPAAPVSAANTLHVTDCANAGANTLRGKIGSAGNGDTIVFDQDCTGGTKITLASTLTLTQTVTIDGSGHTVVIDGGCTGGGVLVFGVSGGATATLSTLTIQHGNSNAGGGILNGGTLTVRNSTLSANNSSAGGFGGGIENLGTLSVTNSTFAGNSAGGGGGGIFNLNGFTLSVTSSTITGNSTSGSGGGIYNTGGSGAVTLTDTIVAGNTAPTGPDLALFVTSGGHNLIGDTSGSSGIANGTNGDIVNASPGLGSLGSNGGPTQTISLLPGSPAIDHGAAVGQGPGTNPVPATDQRGVPHPINGSVDIGAFESFSSYTPVVNSTAADGAANAFNCVTGNPTTCRLRDAIAAVNGSVASGPITFDATAFPANTVKTITLNATAGTLSLTQNMTINGTGHQVVVDGGCTANCGTASASGGVGVFIVNGGVTVAISNLTIRNGNSLGDHNGGAILNNGGTLTVTNCTLSANSAPNGGGIYNTIQGTLTVTSSTFSGNGGTYGGGINNDDGIVTVTNSTFSGNQTFGGNGGGLINGGTMTVTNSTISGNTSGFRGGGILACCDITSHTLILQNTIVAGNTAASSGPDISGTVTSDSHNLIGGTPLLGTLGSNGDTTQTFPLLTGSPAIGAGDPAVCNQTGAGMVNHLDQRGVTRPTSLCAIGAVEPLLSAVAPGSGPIAGGATVTLTGAGFAAGAAVSIGGVSCTNMHVVNSTTLTCTTGAHAAGAVNVVVTVNSQTGTLTGGYTYGVVASLPGASPPGPAGGSPGTLPGSRTAGAPNGSPNPLPAARS